MISVPPKIFRPKVVSQYTTPEYDTIVDDGVFDFKNYGNCVFRPKLTWDPGDRDDIIKYDPIKHEKELMENIIIGDDVDSSWKNEIIQEVIKFWDCFAKEGVWRPIIGYEFAIDTGSSKPVCCKKPSYGPHEAKIIMELMQELLGNNWIHECGGPWGSMIVLAAKPHQEHIVDIADFIWRMCISYRGLNAVTRPFQYPIPRCDDSVAIIEQGGEDIHQIALDACSGYHQVSVKESDREKLAFFAPDNRKYTFSVMPFGPTNAPPFYTAMMSDFKREWDRLFLIKVQEIKILDDKPIRVEAELIFVGNRRIFYGSRTIIDDIFLWCTLRRMVIIYFTCVASVFQKYRVSFKLKKCEFLKNRTEFVGYDVLSAGNCPAQSKFDMINDWELPLHGQSLHSFIGLVGFYSKFSPYMEIRMKPLRKFCRKYFRKEIPFMAYTQDLLELFQDLKKCITSSPVLARYDPDKPTILKTDWSAEGMGYILMQPGDDDQSKEASRILRETGEFLFDKSENGPRLHPVAFGSRACTDIESQFHSFTGEVCGGKYGISQNRRYLWGSHFWWVCDCSAIKEVFDYTGDIPLIKRWAQELLGWHFTIIHRCNQMMRDVDSLTRRYGKLIATHIMVAQALHTRDSSLRPEAYKPNSFKSATSSKIQMEKSIPLIFTQNNIHSSYLDSWKQHSSNTSSHIPLFTSTAYTESTAHSSQEISISTTPILICERQNTQRDTHQESEPKIINSANAMIQTILTINDITASSTTWCNNNSNACLSWHQEVVFTEIAHSNLAIQLQKSTGQFHLPWPALTRTQQFENVCILDITFLPSEGATVMDWFQQCVLLLENIYKQSNCFEYCNLWIAGDSNIAGIQKLFNSGNLKCKSWYTHFAIFRLTDWNECIDGFRGLISISKTKANWQYISNTNKQFRNLESILIPDTPVSAFKSSITLHKESMQDTHEPNPLKSRTVAVISTSSSIDMTKVPSSNLILDPQFPGREPSSRKHNHSIFGRRFGICMEKFDDTQIPTRPLLLQELLRMYSITSNNVNVTDDWADDYLPQCIPPTAKGLILDNLLDAFRISDQVSWGSQEIVDTSSCYFVKRTPEVLEWKASYDTDPSTATIIAGLSNHQGKNWSNEELRQINPMFIKALKAGRIQYQDGKLLLFKPIFKDVKFVGLIIVPQELQRKVFSHYHAGPVGGHMGEYKTLYRLRLRFIWPNMRENIKEWIRGCAHCISHNIWRNRKSELHYSWPVTSPFYIMHLDLWQPGTLLDKDGKTIYLLNCMCDLTQFVVSSLVKNPDAALLAKTFMEDVILTFGICAVVVVDSDSKFKSVFEDMCNKLNLMYWPVSRHNHKGVTVEKYHRYLNKCQTIAGQDRGTHMSILQNYKLAQYGWNSAPIDNTDVPRSLPATGREYGFLLDVDLRPLPNMNDQTNKELYNYLRDVSIQSKFAEEVIKILAEDRRKAHRERHNSTKERQIFKVNDVVTARTTVQSNAETGTVEKLSYRAKGPFQIKEVLQGDSYLVQRYGDDSSATRKYKGSDLFLLPPVIYPHDPLDTTDFRYLNFENAPLVNPLQKNLNIEMYNDVYFSMDGKKRLQEKGHPQTQVDEVANKWHEYLPTTAQMHKETNTIASTPESISLTRTTSNLATKIEDSIDKVFFIKFTPAGTMRARWYPVQIDMISTNEAEPNYADTNKYWCMFLAKHPQDKNKSDEFSRWWPDWYKYSTDPETKEIIYGQRVLINPRTIPPSSTHIQWADSIHLTSDNILLGPFDFQSITSSNRARNIIPSEMWSQLKSICEQDNLLPPTLGSKTTHNIGKRTSSKRRSKRKRANTD